MEYINLNGSEDVLNAGRNISSAADSMTSAANSISNSLYEHQRFLDDWLLRLENILSKEEK